MSIEDVCRGCGIDTPTGDSFKGYCFVCNRTGRYKNNNVTNNKDTSLIGHVGIVFYEVLVYILKCILLFVVFMTIFSIIDWISN